MSYPLRNCLVKITDLVYVNIYELAAVIPHNIDGVDSEDESTIILKNGTRFNVPLPASSVNKRISRFVDDE